MVVRRRRAARDPVVALAVLAPVVYGVAALRDPPALTPLLVAGVLALLVVVLLAVQAVAFRVVLHADHVEARGLTGRVVLPVDRLLRVERTWSRSRQRLPLVPRSGWTRTIIGRTPGGRVRRATLSSRLCDTSAVDPAVDALLARYPHLDAAVQGPDAPWMRWYDRPLGG